jgi:hypothetical protein
MTARTNVHGDVAGLRLVTNDLDATQWLVDQIGEAVGLEIYKEDFDWGLLCFGQRTWADR